jgi:hypothetical protein
VAFVAADTTYHSSVLQRLWTWDGEGAGVALKSGPSFARGCISPSAPRKPSPHH